MDQNLENNNSPVTLPASTEDKFFERNIYIIVIGSSLVTMNFLLPVWGVLALIDFRKKRKEIGFSIFLSIVITFIFYAFMTLSIID